MVETILIVGLVVVLFIAALMLVRTLRFGRKVEPVALLEAAEVDEDIVAEHLAAVIHARTISTGESDPPARVAFLDLHRTLENLYPRVHTHLRREIINDYSLLYIWPGSQPDLPGIVLAAHLDVVPVDPATAAEWEQEPFSGAIADGFVWGRGTLDIKNQVTTLLDAVETLLRNGFQPQRTVYLAFGHDEEIGGLNGGKQIVNWLASHECELEAVLDEGGSIVQGVLPGVKGPVALVGTSEKGYLTLEMTVNAAPGHSSQPPKQSAVGILALALARLEANPMRTHVHMVHNLFAGIGGAAPFGLQFAFANLWLLGGVVRHQLEANPSTNATIRTTTALTIFQSGIKDNILPRQAKAFINFRILPGDTIASVCEHVRRVVDDPRVGFEPMVGAAWEASPLSPDNSPAYDGLDRTIRQIFGNIPVTPYMVLGATDSRHYATLCKQVYRFSPVELQASDLPRMHGSNERIALPAVSQMVQFYLQLIHTWAGE